MHSGCTRLGTQCMSYFIWRKHLVYSHVQGLVDVLHLAIYFGAPRLIALAEVALAATLQAPPSPDFGEHLPTRHTTCSFSQTRSQARPAEAARARTSNHRAVDSCVTNDGF